MISHGAASKSGRAVVVSLHDVSPFTLDACRRIVGEIEQLGAAPVSLLVIPDHHDRGNFADDPAFCEWLKSRIARGDEPVLHGFRHMERRRSPFTLIIAANLTDIYFGSEAEFFRISHDTACRLAMRGLECFARIGIVPAGFIAPAWLLGRNAERAIRDLGFNYTTGVNGVLDFQKNHFCPGRSLCWSTRAAWRRSLSLAWNAVLFRRMASAPLLRVAIHPPDITHPRIWAQILRIITAALRDRTPHTYASWLASSRTASPPAADTSRPVAR